MMVDDFIDFEIADSLFSGGGVQYVRSLCQRNLPRDPPSADEYAHNKASGVQWFH